MPLSALFLYPITGRLLFWVFNRFIRSFIALHIHFFSVTLPSLYIAILTFHQEMIPTTLLITIASSREAIPFPAFVEAIMMKVTFEARREAGLRLPKQIGAAVSIVGGLVIGQAAVQAGIVSAPMVIVVSLTGIASFLVPRYSQSIALRLLCFPIILLAGKDLYSDHAMFFHVYPIRLLG